METLARYIEENSPVTVAITTNPGGMRFITVSRASDLPLNASIIHGIGTNYLFRWDGVGKPIDFTGRQITSIQAFPATETKRSESYFSV